MNDFLLELGCEELPPKALPKLIDALAMEVAKGLDKHELGYKKIEKFAAPRRLALRITQLPLEQPARLIERKGPSLKSAFDADGKPTTACLGFAHSLGVEVADLQTQETKKGSWLFYSATQAGKSTPELLPSIVEQALSKLPIPKPMRWSDKAIEFVRPVHWLVMLFGKQCIDATLLGLKSAQQTFGHRFHHPQPIRLASPKEYEQVLKKAYVLANFEQRKEVIRDQITAIAEKCQAIVQWDEALLDEVTALVEWPVALLADFDRSFLDVPSEALIAAMQEHQKSFALRNQKGDLLPHFITVANIESDHPQRLIHGNEKVMRARLSDAQFFFNEDKKCPLGQRIEATQAVVFQKKLGTLFDKSQRVGQLAAYLAENLEINPDDVARACALSKCDLMTDMVGEFPNLQGIMGYYYAQNDGESSAVCHALKEQYHPRFSKDSLPASPLGSVLALAERIDTLIGIFGINQQPSGVKDPFKCRRLALAVVRIITEHQYDYSLLAVLQKAYLGYENLDNKMAVQDVYHFIIERLKVYYYDRGYRHDVVAAVLSIQSDALADIHARMQALSDFVQCEDATALSSANKRVSKILQHESAQGLSADIQSQYLTAEAETKLAELIEQKQKQVLPLVQKAHYVDALAELASLRQAIDRFFEEVMVMVDDPLVRNNRLALLLRLRGLFMQVADISLIQQPGKHV